MNVNKRRVKRYISNLPSSTTVPIEASTTPRRRSAREPRRQRTELRKSSKLIFVLIWSMMSEYESSFLSLNFPAIRSITSDADGLAHPVQKTSGLKESFSNSLLILKLLQLFMQLVCFANVFRACLCMWIEDLDLKEGFDFN